MVNQNNAIGGHTPGPVPATYSRTTSQGWPRTLLAHERLAHLGALTQRDVAVPAEKARGQHDGEDEPGEVRLSSGGSISDDAMWKPAGHGWLFSIDPRTSVEPSR